MSVTPINHSPEQIRRHFDAKSGLWYFSVTDVIALCTPSSNPRNYWKVLKNRLNKTNKELVTKCNQLKMLSKDGKYYLTDAADSETMLEIIESIPRARIEVFELLVLDKKEKKSRPFFDMKTSTVKLKARCECELETHH